VSLTTLSQIRSESIPIKSVYQYEQHVFADSEGGICSMRNGPLQTPKSLVRNLEEHEIS
jgi:hypothetical protein